MTDAAAGGDRPGERIAALDLLRGVAVLGILLMNVVAFAMPAAAYANPAAWGTRTGLDLAVWAGDAVLVDGRLRGLFSALFGASLLLVADRAEAAGASAAAVHYRRMAWLLVIGLAHLALVWWSDILHHYALVGLVAFVCRKLPAERLVALAATLVLFQFLFSLGLPLAIADAAAAAAGPQPAPGALAATAAYRDALGRPSAAALAAEFAGYRGSYAAVVAYRWPDAVATPWRTLVDVGPETLAYMLGGMAALRAGLLTGAWPPARYARWAAWGFALTLPPYALLAWADRRAGFTPLATAWCAVVLPTLLRPAGIVGWACLILRLGGGGAAGPLAGRLAAAGRMALTNYLATSLIGTTIFYGYGLDQFGRWGRAALLLVVAGTWALLLGWSRPWLARHRYGPAEWLWRSLARGRPQPLRR